MVSDWQELDGLSVEVTEVLYVPNLEAPDDKPHPFVYFINVLNDSGDQIALHGRKWFVREHSGELSILEGRGIVGQYPILPPKDRFSYNSYHVIVESAVAWGAFYGLTASGRRVVVRIPEFGMVVPG